MATADVVRWVEVLRNNKKKLALQSAGVPISFALIGLVQLIHAKRLESADEESASSVALDEVGRKPTVVLKSPQLASRLEAEMGLLRDAAGSDWVAIESQVNLLTEGESQMACAEAGECDFVIDVGADGELLIWVDGVLHTIRFDAPALSDGVMLAQAPTAVASDAAAATAEGGQDGEGGSLWWWAFGALGLALVAANSSDSHASPVGPAAPAAGATPAVADAAPKAASSTTPTTPVDPLKGTEGNDSITGTDDDDRLDGKGGNDTLIGGKGNDIIRGGAGVDVMDGGEGDDIFVIVGDVSGGGKVDSEEDTNALGLQLSSLNGQNLNEDQDGAAEIIRGGPGNDTLYIYGTADISNYDISGIENIVIRSDVTFLASTLQAIQRLTGDGNSTIRIVADDAITAEDAFQSIDLSQIAFSGIGHIDLGRNTEIIMATLPGSVRSISGGGQITVTDAGITFEGIQRTAETNVIYSDGTPVRGGNLVADIVLADGVSTRVQGTEGNDFIRGSYIAETIVGGHGSDFIMGSRGNDVIWGDLENYGEFTAVTNNPGGAGVVAGSNILVHSLGGTAGFGENVLPPNDDGSSAEIDITGVFGEAGLNFFGTRYTSLFINNNGNITFNGPLSTFTPGVINAGANNPIIAPFWADVDTRGPIPAEPTPGGNSAGTNRVWYDMDAEHGILTVTWDDVGYYAAQSDKLNAFQVQLSDRGDGEFDIIYRYEDINWTTGSASGGAGGLGGTVARAGYSAGNGVNYSEISASGNQSAMLALDQGDAVLYEVRNGFALETGHNDIIQAGNGNDKIFGGKGDDSIEGGSGWDEAYFSGRKADYSWVKTGDFWTVTGNANVKDGVDKVFKDVEVLQFADSSHQFVESAETIFKEVGRLDVLGGQSLDLGSEEVIIETGMIRVLADFAKAAYVVQEWESPFINDEKPNSESAYIDVISQGWVPLDLSPEFIHTSTVVYVERHAPGFNGLEAINVNNQMTNGFYSNLNASAFVARSADSLVVAFRGTNDFGDSNIDTAEMWYPDKDQWTNKGVHYGLFSPLVDALEQYVADPSNGILNVYVTGHSLGGAMVSKFMNDHPESVYKSAVTFAAPGYGFFMSEDSRVLHIELDGDPVPDAAADMPGQTVHFRGASFIGAIESERHDMDHYRLVVDVVESAAWEQILSGNENHKTVLLPSTSQLDDKGNVVNYVVDGIESGSRVALTNGDDQLIAQADRIVDIVYGGRGNDVITIHQNSYSVNTVVMGGAGNDAITGGRGPDILIGGPGHDRIAGLENSDRLIGGTGSDTYIYFDDNEGSDVIVGFESGFDRFEFNVDEFDGLAPGTLANDRLVRAVNPEPQAAGQAVFLYDTQSNELSFDEDGSDTGFFDYDSDPVEIALFQNADGISSNDFHVV